MKKTVIAIDGPVAAGKGTVASLLAKKLSITYVDTGAMYRAVAYLGLQHGVNLEDERKIMLLVKNNRLDFQFPKGKGAVLRVFLNAKEISDLIRTPQVSWGSSVVGIHPKVRTYLVKLQQEVAKKESVVMEGRDITTKVLPRANLKVFLTADQNTRVKRRQKQLLEKGIKKSLASILKETKERDYRDEHREADPLKIVPEVFVLDTTSLTINQVVNKILRQLKKVSRHPSL